LIVSPSILYHWLGGKALPTAMGRKLLDSKTFLLFGSVLMAKTRNKQLRSLIHANHLTHMTEYDNPAMLYEAYLGSLSGTVTDRAPHISVPTLLIAGSHDDLAPPAAQRRLLQQLPSAELVVIDNVGHLIHYETPLEAAEAIDQFIAKRLRK
jgi:pimeloyl-ACP methyl ester carboxylesterase